MRFQASRDKLAWAEHHRLLLEPEITAFVQAEPIKLRSETNLSSGVSPVQCRYFVSKIEQPPAHWALVVGDAVQNMRAALDYSIWALVVRDKGDDFAYANRHKVDFPIVDDPVRFPTKRLETIGLSKAVIAVVNDAQPYSASDGLARDQPLWHIGSLSNIDKHRLLHVVSMIGEEALVRTVPNLGPGTVEFIAKEALRKGAEVVRFSAVRPAGVSDLKVTFDFKLGIDIDGTSETKAAPIDLILRSMHTAALDVIDQLSAATTKPQSKRRNKRSRL